ncbi:hypothetical protein NPIL_58521 [Nephila pilipes]|uniref:Uncharacterized protein n=1 Tax=Nephila pilipes TaxID=299642 RepID=A0A8X6U4W5_NEPPI|nr:hypothetical protein NPIL_58521 [Nephila pilipes]
MDPITTYHTSGLTPFRTTETIPVVLLRKRGRLLKTTLTQSVKQKNLSTAFTVSMITLPRELNSLILEPMLQDLSSLLVLPPYGTSTEPGGRGR